MKKRAVLFGLLMLVFLFLFASVVAVNDGDNINQLNEQSNKVNSETINKNVNNALTQEFQIPENLQIVGRLIFAIKEGEIDFSIFIVLIAIWVVLLMLIRAALELVPLFEGDWKSWFVAVIVTLLIANTGAVNEMALFFFNLGGFVQGLKEYGILKLIFTLIIIGILFYGLFVLLRIIRHEIKKEKRRGEGFKVGSGL